METNQEPSNPPYQSFGARLGKYIPYLEMAFLGIVIVGILLGMANIAAREVLMVGFTGLAGAFFLSAYKPPVSVEQKDGGFKDLLVLTVIPKVLWIACSISTIAICFYTLGLTGYKEMMQVGGLAIAGGLFLLLFVAVTGSKNLQLVIPILYRAIPLALIDGYIMYVASSV